jgi:ATP-dependent DNA helicase HFM1/MER3
MKMTAKSLRLVALSATIPNARLIASWLNGARLLAFPDSMRPVPLEWHVLGTSKQGKNSFTFEYSLNYRLPELISKYSPEKPVLIVAHEIQPSGS